MATSRGCVDDLSHTLLATTDNFLQVLPERTHSLEQKVPWVLLSGIPDYVVDLVLICSSSASSSASVARILLVLVEAR